MMQQLSFRTESTCRACTERDQTGHAYSAAEKHKASRDVLNVCGLEPHCEQVSLRNILLRAHFSLTVLDMLSEGQRAIKSYTEICWVWTVF